MANVLTLSGSLREGSFNTSLLNVAASILRQNGAETVGFDFRTNALPIYDADLESKAGFPDSVVSLKSAVRESDAILIAGPEYNSGPTPLLKNAIDWVSRAAHGEKNEWDGKVVSVISASPGQFGGVRAQSGYRSSLAFLGAFVLPELITLPRAGEAFDEKGNLLNERTKAALEKGMARLLEVSSRLRGL